MSRPVNDNVVALEAGHGFLRRVVGLVGSADTSVPYERDSAAATSLGVIGEFLGRTYDESRQRPKFVIRSRHGFDEPA